MVLLFVMMVALCTADLVSEYVIHLARRLRAPRSPIARARRYRFS